MKRNNKKGFTIVELVIVIAVIAILAGVLIPTFTGIIKKAQDSAILQEMRSALTVILAEEDSQMDASAQYVFIYTEEDEDPVYFEYDKTDKTVKKIDFTEVGGIDKTNKTLTPLATATVWCEEATDATWNAANIVKTNLVLSGDAQNTFALEDLDNIVVVKIK